MIDGENELLRYLDLERLMGVPQATLRVWVHLRRIPHVRLGPRTVRFDKPVIERWLAERSVNVVGSGK